MIGENSWLFAGRSLARIVIMALVAVVLTLGVFFGAIHFGMVTKYAASSAVFNVSTVVAVVSIVVAVVTVVTAVDYATATVVTVAAVATVAASAVLAACSVAVVATVAASVDFAVVVFVAVVTVAVAIAAVVVAPFAVAFAFYKQEDLFDRPEVVVIFVVEAAIIGIPIYLRLHQ